MTPEKIRERLAESRVDAEEYVRALRAVRGDLPRDREEPRY
jgi:hypothetical protein